MRWLHIPRVRAASHDKAQLACLRVRECKVLMREFGIWDARAAYGDELVNRIMRTQQ